MKEKPEQPPPKPPVISDLASLRNMALRQKRRRGDGYFVRLWASINKV